MKNIRYILLISACCFLPKESCAEINLTFDASNIVSSNPTLHTHHTPVELKPISNFTKLAAVCSIVDGGCDGMGFNSDNDYTLNTEEICFSKGYNLTSCLDNKKAKDFCPDDNKYFRSCGCANEFKYTLSSCKMEFANSQLGEEQCSSDGTTYSNSCVCDTIKYPYTSSNCNGNENLSGTICKDMSGISYGSGCICTPTAGACSGYDLDTDTCGGGSKIGESCHNGCNTKWRCKELAPSCEIGSILYSDKSCSKAVVSGKAAIAIVFDTNKRLAIALDEASSKMTWHNKVDWRDVDYDIPNLEHLDPDGKANTAKIIAYGNLYDIPYPAAKYCNRYITNGTISGEWFLPSEPELVSIYNTKKYINASLQLLGREELSQDYYWSSGESYDTASMSLDMNFGIAHKLSKHNYFCVRAVLAY